MARQLRRLLPHEQPSPQEYTVEYLQRVQAGLRNVKDHATGQVKAVSCPTKLDSLVNLQVQKFGKKEGKSHDAYYFLAHFFKANAWLLLPPHLHKREEVRRRLVDGYNAWHTHLYLAPDDRQTYPRLEPFEKERDRDIESFLAKYFIDGRLFLYRDPRAAAQAEARRGRDNTSGQTTQGGGSSRGDFGYFVGRCTVSGRLLFSLAHAVAREPAAVTVAYDDRAEKWVEAGPVRQATDLPLFLRPCINSGLAGEIRLPHDHHAALSKPASPAATSKAPRGNHTDAGPLQPLRLPQQPRQPQQHKPAASSSTSSKSPRGNHHKTTTATSPAKAAKKPPRYPTTTEQQQGRPQSHPPAAASRSRRQQQENVEPPSTSSPPSSAHDEKKPQKAKPPKQQQEERAAEQPSPAAVSEQPAAPCGFFLPPPSSPPRLVMPPQLMLLDDWMPEPEGGSWGTFPYAPLNPNKYRLPPPPPANQTTTTTTVMMTTTTHHQQAVEAGRTSLVLPGTGGFDFHHQQQQAVEEGRTSLVLPGSGGFDFHHHQQQQAVEAGRTSLAHQQLPGSVGQHYQQQGGVVMQQRHQPAVEGHEESKCAEQETDYALACRNGSRKRPASSSDLWGMVTAAGSVEQLLPSALTTTAYHYYDCHQKQCQPVSPSGVYDLELEESAAVAQQQVMVVEQQHGGGGWKRMRVEDPVVGTATAGLQEALMSMTDDDFESLLSVLDPPTATMLQRPSPMA